VFDSFEGGQLPESQIKSIHSRVMRLRRKIIRRRSVHRHHHATGVGSLRGGGNLGCAMER
jgi:hypothetical protein